MSYQNVFKRYELKYIINEEQYKAVRAAMESHMNPDKYGNSTICNIYYDTPNFILARRSIEKPFYKEKLRLRSYGLAQEKSQSYIEIKKKFDSVVYKRRIELPYNESISYLSGDLQIEKTQIVSEIDSFINMYEGLEPAMVISYEREAFYDKEDSNFRMTFDKNILCRDYDLSLDKGIYGEDILKKGIRLLEVKTATSIPLWLCNVLSEYKIYKTSFSKYGTAYENKFRRMATC